MRWAFSHMVQCSGGSQSTQFAGLRLLPALPWPPSSGTPHSSSCGGPPSAAESSISMSGPRTEPQPLWAIAAGPWAPAQNTCWANGIRVRDVASSIYAWNQNQNQNQNRERLQGSEAPTHRQRLPGQGSRNAVRRRRRWRSCSRGPGLDCESESESESDSSTFSPRGHRSMGVSAAVIPDQGICSRAGEARSGASHWAAGDGRDVAQQSILASWRVPGCAETQPASPCQPGVGNGITSGTGGPEDPRHTQPLTSGHAHGHQQMSLVPEGGDGLPQPLSGPLDQRQPSAGSRCRHPGRTT